jgi:hypothetical protein
MTDDAYLQHLFRDSRCVELRHHHAGRWESGLYDDQGAFERDVAARAGIGNLYTSLNRPDPSRVRVTNGFRSRPLENADIAVITRLPFDFDPVRPPGSNSTDAELEAACACRDAVVSSLTAAGWPMPLVAVSGNGAHAVWRTNILPDEDWRQGAAILYWAIRQQFHELLESRRVRFDTTVRNPGRIWRLYGSINRKAAPTPERPQRMACCVLPRVWEAVQPIQAQRLIDAWGPHVVQEKREQTAVQRGDFKRGTGDYRSLDVVSWFLAHDAYLHPLGGNVHGVVCPWSDRHTVKGSASETIIFEATDSWPEFFCHHNHCEGRTIRDVMALWGDMDGFCAWSYGVPRGFTHKEVI